MTEIKYSKTLPEDFSLEKVYGVIYKITNLVNNKVYIGQSTNVKGRFSKYKNLHNKSQQYLYNTFLKHGISNFEFEVIDSAPDLNVLNFLEIFYIDCFKSTDRSFGYNIASGGIGGGKMSNETKDRISKSNLGRKISEEIMSKRRVRSFSEETKEKMRLAKLGKIPWNKRKKMTDETKLKISKSNLGRKCTDATKLKISKSSLGKRSFLGKIHSEETKLKISVSYDNKRFNKYFEFFYSLILY